MNPFKYTKEYKIVEMLVNAGEQAYFVGGCVRDLLLEQQKVGGHQSFKNLDFLEDIDVCTSASPEKAQEILSSKFSEFNLVGERFGVLMVKDVEIAQFRTETYKQGKLGKPEVVPTDSMEQDASRRDFTMNALYMDLEGNVYDFFDGVLSLEFETVKAVGNAEERFKEDPSRILRMFYLAARFGFKIDSNTLEAAVAQEDLIKEIPDALVGKILKKVLSHNKLSSFLSMLEQANLLHKVFPEFEHTLNKPQNPKYHNSQVFEHTLRVIQYVEENHHSNKLLLMSAWTHDIAKGMEGIRAVDEHGKISDIGHEFAGSSLARELCIRLQFGTDFAKEVEFLVKHHGLRFYKGFKLSNYNKLIRKLAKDCKNKEELKSRAVDLVSLMRADASGFAPEFSKEVLENIETYDHGLFRTIHEEQFFVSELEVNGNDVIQKWSDKRFMKYTGEVLELIVKDSNSKGSRMLQLNAIDRITKEFEKAKVIL